MTNELWTIVHARFSTAKRPSIHILLGLKASLGRFRVSLARTPTTICRTNAMSDHPHDYKAVLTNNRSSRNW